LLIKNDELKTILSEKIERLNLVEEILDVSLKCISTLFVVINASSIWVIYVPGDNLT